MAAPTTDENVNTDQSNMGNDDHEIEEKRKIVEEMGREKRRNAEEERYQLEKGDKVDRRLEELEEI